MTIAEKENIIKEQQLILRKIPPEDTRRYNRQKNKIEKLKKQFYTNLDRWDIVCLARSPQRAKAQDYISALFSDFYPFCGDRCFGEDRSITAGIARYNGRPVTVIAQSKGTDLADNLKKNFGMVSPEGYRKVIRLAKQAEKFSRPIITIVDTPGAYPGKGAEERGQAQAIAQCLYTFSNLKTPVICIVISEGGSGGALALSVADRIYMLENAVYSILSPEVFASILYKDETLAPKAARQMKMTAADLYQKHIIDEIVKEPLGGAGANIDVTVRRIRNLLNRDLPLLTGKKMKNLLEERYEKYRRIGVM